MNATIYLEGGASGAGSKELQIRCREGFRKLLEKCGYKRPRLPHLVASGSRTSAFHDFKVALAGRSNGSYMGLWIDSEDPLTDLEATWAHLRRRDNWPTPADVTDEQVLFMTTCMETLIAADRGALNDYYGAQLQSSALPPLVNLENRGRHEVQAGLTHATRNCKRHYAKGAASFELLAKLSPNVLFRAPPQFCKNPAHSRRASLG